VVGQPTEIVEEISAPEAGKIGVVVKERVDFGGKTGDGDEFVSRFGETPRGEVLNKAVPA
jgi:hypothetical protein